MSQKAMASVLLVFALGFFAVVGNARQPEAKLPPAPKAAYALDGLIAAALVHDADVKLAQAKLQLAEAEVARARQLVAQRVAALDSAIREQKKLVTTAEAFYKITNDALAKGQGSFVESLQARERLELAQSKLAVVETELKSLTGAGTLKPADGNETHYPGVGSKVVIRFLPLKGAIADRIRTALDKPVKLGEKGATVTFRQALDIFKKDAGFDVPIRDDMKIESIGSLGEELPVGAWMQLFADGTIHSRFVVREYGLLITSKDLVPPDAISLQDFWKQGGEKKEPKTP